MQGPHLVAWETQHHQSLLAVLVVHTLQLCVLRGEATGTCSRTVRAKLHHTMRIGRNLSPPSL